MFDGSLSARRWAVVVATATTVALVATAPAAEAAATPSQLYACVTARHSTLNLTTRTARCPAGQAKITWRVDGTRGKPGAKGDDGANGEPGAKGDSGVQGGAGGPGVQGAPGTQGPAGSADTAEDVLAKLITVDGAGSALDADLLGGLPSAQWQQRVTGGCAAGSYVRAIATDGTVTCETTNAGVSAPLALTQADTTGVALNAAITNASSGERVIGVTNAGVGPGIVSTTNGNALWGITQSISSAAVIGDSTSGEAIVGRQTGATCEANIGGCVGIGSVVGRHDGRGGYGVRGFVTDVLGGIGVLGQSGISGGTGTAVRGENVNAANPSNALEAVTNGSGSAIFAQGTTAGTFNGSVVVNGDLTVTGTKSGFRIDDPRAPTSRTLTHTPVETNALTVTYSGNVRTDADGRAVVRLPEYAETLAGDWRYQLTPIGRFGQAIVEREVRDGRFIVRTEHGGMKVSWNVTGMRRDPQAQSHAIDPVTEKRGRDRGRYLDPKLYGQPASRGAAERLSATPGRRGASAAASTPRPKLASER